MDGHGDREAIVSHIEAIAGREPAEASELAISLLRHCWPVRPSDRSEPGALPWLRRWGPRGVEPPRPACTCARGTCAVCN